MCSTGVAEGHDLISAQGVGRNGLQDVGVETPKRRVSLCNRRAEIGQVVAVPANSWRQADTTIRTVGLCLLWL